jgi:hypothetical protein
MPKYQKQETTVAGLVAAASRRGHQLADFKAGEVAVSGLAAVGTGPGRPPLPVFLLLPGFCVRDPTAPASVPKFRLAGIFTLLSRVSTPRQRQTLINRYKPRGAKINSRQIGSKGRMFV